MISRKIFCKLGRGFGDVVQNCGWPLLTCVCLYAVCNIDFYCIYILRCLLEKQALLTVGELLPLIVSVCCRSIFKS